MNDVRGLYSSKTKIRHQIFTEVARFAYEGGDYSKFENLPYKIIPGEISKYRESVFLERAIVGERLRLAMGLPLLPADKQAPISTGVEESMIDEKVYDPPLINIIKFACHKCPEKRAEKLTEETGIPVSTLISLLKFLSKAPPPEIVIPCSIMSEESSGGVFSRVVLIASIIREIGSCIASRSSEELTFMFSGRPFNRLRPRRSA